MSDPKQQLRPIKVKGGIIDDAKTALEVNTLGSLRGLVSLFLEVFAKDPNGVYSYLIALKTGTPPTITSSPSVSTTTPPATTGKVKATNPLASALNNL